MTVHSPLLNGSQRRPTRQGAILVPNSRLARGNGLYRKQLSASVSHAKGGDANNTTWICLLDSGQRLYAFTSRFYPGHGDKAACTESKERAKSEALYPCRQTDNPPTSLLAAWSNIYHLTCDLKVTAGQSASHHHTRDNLILSSRCTPFFLLRHEGDPVRCTGRWNPITSWSPALWKDLRNWFLTASRPSPLRPGDRIGEPGQTHNWLLTSSQPCGWQRVKTVSMRSGKPVYIRFTPSLHPTLSLKQFYVRLIDDRPFSSFQGRSSSASSFHASLLQAIDGVMSLALCPLVLSQDPQHFRSSETQATCDGCN